MNLSHKYILNQHAKKDLTNPRIATVPILKV
jgi:hypothetical protein